MSSTPHMPFDAVYYEPAVLELPLGKQLQQQFSELQWFPIESHNRIPEMQQKENKEFARMKRFLIIGQRKTHKYVENQKISDWLVPYTSSGCSAMCLYCYLVCNYNKCAYLRLFVNREQMLDRLIKHSYGRREEQTYEIGSNSDLILENTITGNLPWTIERFAKEGRGHLTFPTKFDMVDPLLSLDHRGKTIFRMSVNPNKIISKIELKTSPLSARIKAINRMCDAGYPTGILIAPVIFVEGWEQLYDDLLTRLSDELSDKVKSQLFIEVIFMTYSYVHRAINKEAFPHATELFDPELMTGRGRGKYSYKTEPREKGEELLKKWIEERLPNARIIYFC